MLKSIASTLFFALSAILLATPAKAQFELDLETGGVFSGRNDIRISGDQGTLFSFTEDLDAEAAFFYRLRASYTINNRHTLSALYAPLTVTSNGSVGNDVLFEGTVFPAATPLEGSYTFNSYRLTYRYRFVDKEKFLFGLGFTAKIRDANINVTSAELFSEKVNVGFVPIINFRLWWKMNEQFGLLLDGDALAAPQGRAEDVSLSLTYKVNENIGVRAGYRILEGGADNDEVYNFSLFNYGLVGVSYGFGG